MAANVMIIQAPYYEEIAKELLAGAEAALTAAGAGFQTISVPGALEIPGAIALAEDTDQFDGYVALGCVIRGETSHYDIVAGESARGLMALTMEGLSIGNGILTCENRDQAMARATTSGKNKGGEAANAVLAMVKLREEFGSGS